MPFLLLGFQKGVHQGIQQGADVVESDVFTAAVKKAISSRTLDKAKGIIGTTKDDLKSLIQQAVDEGWGTKKLTSEIKGLYESMSGPRSQTIARTELTSVINDGTYQSLDAGGYQQKEWSTVIDGRERDSHHDADGQVVGIDDPFQLDGGEGMYPGDPNLPPEESINCRCVVLASGLPEDRRQQLGEAFLRLHSTLEQQLMVALRAEFSRQEARVLAHFPS